MSKLGDDFAKDDSKEVTGVILRNGKLYDPVHDNYKREPFASDIRASKVSPIYNAHSYHTKVPFQGIEPFIEHYTHPGDLILDPFCGSGMTGVATLRLGRKPILIDLCPSATFIAYNYCTPVNVQEFRAEEDKLVKQVTQEIDWLYETRCRKCGGKASIKYMIWSDEFQCPRCNQGFSLWAVAVKGDHVETRFQCPICKKELRKNDCSRVGSRPVRVEYVCPKCGREQDGPSEFDLKKLEEIECRWNHREKSLSEHRDNGFWPLDENKRRLWIPTFKMPEGINTQQPKASHNITHVNEFYTLRALWALARMWQIIFSVSDSRIRAALKWVFTSFNPSLVSKLTRYNFGKRGAGPLTGTLYVPSFTVERNLISIWKNKSSAILQVFESMHIKSSSIVSTQSATCMTNIPTSSIDYVFTDPPFGGNLMYSELNFIWESWLGRFTNPKEEAIINRTQGKGITEYQELMTRSLKEIYRVLKPSRWMTMVFHNSDGEVWQAIQDGLSAAGFAVGMIGIFDKKQRSFKQVTSSGAVGYDVVINCYKPKATVKNGIEGKTTNDAVVGFLADHLLRLPLIHGQQRTARMLHSKTIGFFMLQNKPLRSLSFEDLQKILKANFREIDGYWYLPYQRPRMKGQKKLFGYVSNEIEAIEWIEGLLKVPRKYGDIAPQFFKALGPNKLKKDLQELLHDNFVEENGIWRNPTRSERETLLKRLTDKTARQINLYLSGQSEYIPNDETLCEWIEFSYNNGLYKEGATLFHYINEKSVHSATFQKTRKIAEICRLKSWEGS